MHEIRKWFKPFNYSQLDLRHKCAWYTGVRNLVIRFVKEGPRHDLTPLDYKNTSRELEATVRASYWFYSMNGRELIAEQNPLHGIESPEQVSRIHLTGVFTPRTEKEYKRGACSSIVCMSAPHFQQLCHMMATKVTTSLQVRHVLGQYTVKASSDTAKEVKQGYVVGCGTEVETQGELQYRSATAKDAKSAQSFNTLQLMQAITRIAKPLPPKERSRGKLLEKPIAAKSEHAMDFDNYTSQLKKIADTVMNHIQ